MKQATIMFLVLLLTVGITFAKGKNTYMVTIPHTKEECMSTINDVKDKGNALLSKVEWGCMDNDHTGYAFLTGTDAAEVKKMLPQKAQAKAKIVKVGKLTAKQIEQMHKEH